MNIRPAQVGDEGVLLGQESQGGMATLTIQIGEGQLAYLHGDWRTVADLVEALQGERVEIVEAEGSVYGAYAVRLAASAE